MPTIENLLDEEEGAEDENVSTAIPGNKTRKTDRETISNSTEHRINFTNQQPIKRGRGRPPGSGTSNKRNARGDTQPEQFWIRSTALGLNWASLLMASYIFHDKKYIMTRVEAEAAGKSLMIVAFHYKTFRDIAVTVNGDSDWAILLKGFMPYLSRILLKDLMEDVLSGLTFSGTKQRKSPRNGGNTNSTSYRGNGTTGADVGKSNDGFSERYDAGGTDKNNVLSFTPKIDGPVDWRNID